MLWPLPDKIFLRVYYIKKKKKKKCILPHKFKFTQSLNSDIVITDNTLINYN